MKTITLSASCAALIQFFLLHSHKIGAKHWTWVFGASILVFIFSIYQINRKLDISRIRMNLATGSLLCLLGPPATYLLKEWNEVPAHLINSINQGAGTFIGALVFISGGWVFAMALVACYWSRIRR